MVLLHGSKLSSAVFVDRGSQVIGAVRRVHVRLKQSHSGSYRAALPSEHIARKWTACHKEVDDVPLQLYFQVVWKVGLVHLKESTGESHEKRPKKGIRSRGHTKKGPLRHVCFLHSFFARTLDDALGFLFSHRRSWWSSPGSFPPAPRSPAAPPVPSLRQDLALYAEPLSAAMIGRLAGALAVPKARVGWTGRGLGSVRSSRGRVVVTRWYQVVLGEKPGGPKYRSRGLERRRWDCISGGDGLSAFYGRVSDSVGLGLTKCIYDDFFLNCGDDGCSISTSQERIPLYLFVFPDVFLPSDGTASCEPCAACLSGLRGDGVVLVPRWLEPAELH